MDLSDGIGRCKPLNPQGVKFKTRLWLGPCGKPFRSLEPGNRTCHNRKQRRDADGTDRPDYGFDRRRTGQLTRLGVARTFRNGLRP